MPTASTTTKHPSSLGMRSSTAPPALGSTGPHLAGAFVEPADAGTPADAIPVPSTVNHDVGPFAAVQGNLHSEMFNDQNATVWTFRDYSVDKSSGLGGGLQSTMNDAWPVVLKAMKSLLVFTMIDQHRPLHGRPNASRLSLLFFVFSENAGKTRDIPKLVDQVPSGSEHSKSL
jgi:hypothetical protein